MAKLYFFYSAMNAGKTTHLLQQNHNLKEKNLKTLLFIPEIAGNNGVIESRIGLKENAIKITNNLNLFVFTRNYKENIKYILIDEAQFLKKKNVFEIISVVDILNISVFTYGLRTDFKSKLFEGSKYLLSMADNIIELKTLCSCGRKAIMNVRTNLNKKKIIAGDQININKNIYISVCRYHYYNMNNFMKC